MQKKVNSDITVICTPLRFYTHNDEELFFGWIKKIQSVKEFKGIGRELHLYISSKKIPNKDLLDLIGLFGRYKLDIKQLHVFKNKDNEDWFK